MLMPESAPALRCCCNLEPILCRDLVLFFVAASDPPVRSLLCLPPSRPSRLTTPVPTSSSLPLMALSAPMSTTARKALALMTKHLRQTGATRRHLLTAPMDCVSRGAAAPRTPPLGPGRPRNSRSGLVRRAINVPLLLRKSLYRNCSLRVWRVSTSTIASPAVVRCGPARAFVVVLPHRRPDQTHPNRRSVGGKMDAPLPACLYSTSVWVLTGPQQGKGRSDRSILVGAESSWCGE